MKIVAKIWENKFASYASETNGPFGDITKYSRKSLTVPKKLKEVSIVGFYMLR